MNFYNQKTSEVITEGQMIARYGTKYAIPQLSIISIDDAKAAFQTRIASIDLFLASAEPIAVDGYYPLYTTSDAADTASSSNSHHTHLLNGVTYYMPDGGTIYHGNYTS